MLSRRSLIAGAIGALAAPNIGLAAAWRPKRIIAIGGPITEILFGLGCGDQIVAVDQTSRFPGAARRKGDAGFHDDLSAAQLLSHAPDLVVSGEETSIADVKDALARSSVRVSSLKSVRRASDVTQRIRAAGDAVGDPGRGAALADAVAEDLSSLSDDLGRLPARRRALIVMGLGSGHPMIVGGAGSPAALALEMAGGVNATGHFSGWKALKNDQVAALEPEAVVALSIGAPLLAADVSAHPALKGTAAARENRVAVADALAFTGFGPRTAHVIAAAAQAIYPDARFRPLPRREWLEDDLVSL